MRWIMRDKSGNLVYALDKAYSMADNESDLETDGLELALDSLCLRHCRDESSLNSKDYCSEFCELVEEYTAQWHVPLPQLKVLRTALCNFTKATSAFPDDCQHVHYVLSSLALSFFELMLFFSREEFVEKPLKNILDCFQECHLKLLRHRNIYLHHVKQVIKGGGPWENSVLQRILKEGEVLQSEVDDYFSAELPIFLELRVRYLQACERMQEAMALSKSCLENQEIGKHLYFHQAYLTCLYKASLYEKIDGRDAVEIICNTESVEKDELLLSLCKAFLTRQLHKGDMYYIWLVDLVFIWSRLHLRAYPSRQGFLAECSELASSATNVRAIFPFIKLLTELGGEGVVVAVELCARALHLCDMQSDTVTCSLVCKTIAFLLPHDLEICRACSLLVFCQERSLEAYRTVCLLYRHPDQEQHPHNNPLRTNVRFHILQMLKERLCFDPEFWNLLTLRTHCLELMSDKVMKDAVLDEMKLEEEKESSEYLLPNNCVNESCTLCLDSSASHIVLYKIIIDLYILLLCVFVQIKPIKTWREKLLRTQQYGHLSYTCKICHKTFKGLNVMRHAFSHLKNRKLKCILCGKRFKLLPLAKKHILEHINEMSNHKPNVEQMQENPPTNGIMENEHPPDKEIETPVAENETSEQKPKSKSKKQVLILNREERIIRNIRVLLRKTALFHKRNKRPNTEINLIEFTDEQVVITDGLVIIKNVASIKEEVGEEGKETPVGENGCSVDYTYPLCPSDVCDRVFLKLNSSLTKHAIKCHLGEEKVLEKTYIWSKHKCCFCVRHMQFLDQYKHHMKLHDDPLPFFCYHIECKQRFATQPELKDHINTHQPFRPQCSYPDCEKLFSCFQGLSDHEWRHYIPVPQRKELDLGANLKDKMSKEAPWKQRVKIEEIWLQNKKSQSQMSPTSDKIKAEDGETTSLDNSQDLVTCDNCPTTTLSPEILEDRPTINGFEEVTKLTPEESKAATGAAKTPKKKPEKKLINWDVINIREYQDISTLAEGIQKNIAEPHITEHKTFKPEDPAYAQFVKTPFVRPPPSTYLDESVLSMRKRSSADQQSVKKYVRHRCGKCLSSFSTLEELQMHEGRNTCSSLFGFDSDDES
uniref:Zinc finger protein 654 n=1 Tax=Xiphophorus maculatus TaxID=8083 RepID=M4A2T6_XIPMA